MRLGVSEHGAVHRGLVADLAGALIKDLLELAADRLEHGVVPGRVHYATRFLGSTRTTGLMIVSLIAARSWAAITSRAAVTETVNAG